MERGAREAATALSTRALLSRTGVPLVTDRDLDDLAALAVPDPSDGAGWSALHARRRALAAMLDATPTGMLASMFQTATGGIFHMLVERFGMRERAPDDTDLALIDRLAEPVEGTHPPWGRILARLLFAHPAEIVDRALAARCPQTLEGGFFAICLRARVKGHDDAEQARIDTLIEVVTEATALRGPRRNGTYGHRNALQAFVDHANFSVYLAGTPKVETMRDRDYITRSWLQCTGRIVSQEIAPLAAANSRIKVGFLVWNLEERVETHLLFGYAAGFDRKSYAIHLVSLSPVDREGIALAPRLHADDRVIDLHASDFQSQLDAIQALELDFMIFPNNFLSRPATLARLATFRLARVQIATLACPASTGGGETDYFLTSTLAEGTDDPAAIAGRYAETPLLIDHEPCCFAGIEADRPPAVPRKGCEGQAAIDAAYALFGADARICLSGAQFVKHNDALYDAWAEILRRVPSAVLILYPLNPDWKQGLERDATRARILSAFEARGTEPRRIIVAGPFEDADSIVVLNQRAHLYLDSFPYSGCASMLDPLTSNLVPVTLAGKDQKGHQGAMLLEGLGMEALVAKDGAAYVATAVEMLEDDARRREVARRIALGMHEARFLDPAAMGRQLMAVLRPLYRDRLAQGAVTLAARANRGVDLDAGANALFGPGWHIVETDGTTTWRWSTERATLSIAHQFTRPARLRLTFSHIFGSDASGISVTAAGEAIPCRVEKGPDGGWPWHLVGDVPERLLTGTNRLEVAIAVGTAARPSDLDAASTDERMLGAAIARVRLDAIDDADSGPEEPGARLAVEPAAWDLVEGGLPTGPGRSDRLDLTLNPGASLYLARAAGSVNAVEIVLMQGMARDRLAGLCIDLNGARLGVGVSDDLRLLRAHVPEGAMAEIAGLPFTRLTLRATDGAPLDLTLGRVSFVTGG